MRPRDSRRKRLYDAERAAFPEFYGPPLPLPEVRRWVARIERSRWWTGRFGRTTLEVLDGRGRRKAGGWSGWRPGITLPRWSRTRPIVLHEIAHAVQPPGTAAHGPEFCRLYLDLVGRWIGPEAAATLRQSMRQGGVRVSTRARAYRGRP